MKSKQQELVATLIVIVLILSIFGQLLKVEISLSGILIPVYPADLVAGFLTLLMLINSRKKFRELLELGGVKFWLAWIGSAALSWLIILPQIDSGEVLIGLSYLLRYCTYMSWVWLIAITLGVKEKAQILKMLKFITLFFATAGLAIYLIRPDMRFMYYSGWDDHFYRLTGLFFDPGYTGLWLVWGMIIWLHDYVEESNKWYIHLGRTLAMIIFVVSLGLTFSRASYLSVGIGILLWSVISKKRITGVAVILALIISVYLAPKPSGEGVNLARTSTSQFRLINASQATEVINLSPWLGSGFNRTRFVKEKLGILESNSDEHSGAGFDISILFLLATTGVFGTTLWLIYWWQIGEQMWDMQLNQKAILVAVFGAWFVHGLFHNSWFYAPNVLWSSVLLGTMLFCQTKENKKLKAIARTRFRLRRLS